MKPTNPEEIKESARRLLVLAEFLEKLPMARFDYQSWVGNDWKGKQDLSCGTTACALGWAATMPEFRALGLRIIPQDVPWSRGVVGTDKHADPFLAAQDTFLLDDVESTYLFHPSDDLDGFEEESPSPGDDASAVDVATHIRYFVVKYRAAP